jgi:hypothetical protein
LSRIKLRGSQPCADLLSATKNLGANDDKASVPVQNAATPEASWRGTWLSVQDSVQRPFYRTQVVEGMEYG